MTISNADGYPRKDNGFTLIELLISIFVITVGLVSLLAVFGVAITATQVAREDMIAKQLAQEAMESLITGRETTDLTWNQIQNVGPTGGIYLSGFQPILQAGADGIIGTIDDAGAPAVTMQDPGPDGVVGTADDPAPVPLTNFRRSISITPTGSGDLRNVVITIRYSIPQSTAPKTYVLTGLISQYR